MARMARLTADLGVIGLTLTEPGSDPTTMPIEAWVNVGAASSIHEDGTGVVLEFVGTFRATYRYEMRDEAAARAGSQLLTRIAAH